MAQIDGKFFQSDFVQEQPSGTINGANLSFTLGSAPANSAMVMVFVNGIYQIPSTHFSVSGTTLTFTSGNAPATGSDVRVAYWKRN